MRAALVLVVILLVGCPARDPESDVDAGAGGPDAPAGGALLQLTCNADMSQLPRFARQCGDPGECAIARHQVDCCGSATAHGIRADQLDAFAAAESACQALFPGCGCPPQPTVAEDGDSEAQGTIMVACESSVCVTFVP
jgi:hypothetical protein